MADAVTARANARAATIDDVVFLPDRHGPLATPTVQGLLAHELAHIDQAVGPGRGGHDAPERDGEERQAAAIEAAVRTGWAPPPVEVPPRAEGALPGLRPATGRRSGDHAATSFAEGLHLPGSRTGRLEPERMTFAAHSAPISASPGQPARSTAADSSVTAAPAADPVSIPALPTLGSPAVARAGEAPVLQPDTRRHEWSEEDLDRIYTRVTERLRHDLLVERERTGGLVELAWG